jgi:two-component system, OmpR family, alkaline phosphatase synthesis response regulator PhoP
MEGKESSEIPKTHKILYIEDDANLRKLLPRFAVGFQFTVVDSMPKVEDALEREWDAIVTDFDFPGGNGFEVAGRVREKGIETPVVIISGRKFDPEELEEHGVKYSLQKPFEPEAAVKMFEDLKNGMRPVK